MTKLTLELKSENVHEETKISVNSRYSNDYGNIIDYRGEHILFYFVCDTELPVRGFAIKDLQTISYITCHIKYNDILIICNPIAEMPVFNTLFMKDNHNMILSLSGYAVNVPYPYNEREIRVELSIECVKNKITNNSTKQVEIQFNAHAKTVKCMLPKVIHNLLYKEFAVPDAPPVAPVIDIRKCSTFPAAAVASSSDSIEPTPMQTQSPQS